MNESDPDLARTLISAQHRLKLCEDWCDMMSQVVDMSDAYSWNEGPRAVSGSMIPGGMPDPMLAYSRSLIYPGATAWAYINEIELRQIRARTRVFVQTNPYAIGAARNRVSYTVGSGHTYKVLPKDPDDDQEDMLQDCRKVLDDFRKRNCWPKRQKETVRRLDRDGERFLRLFIDKEAGELNVRFVEPLEVQNPPGETSATGCYFGIGFKRIAGGEIQPVWDIETPEVYYLVNIGTLGEVVGLREKVPADQMQHLKANVDMTWPRGLPTWFALQSHLNDGVKTLKATGKIVEFRARIGMIRRHINGTQAAVQTVVDAMRAGTNGPTGVQTAGKYPYAAIIDTSDATEYQFPSGTVPVDGNVAAIQAELRACAAALAMPEYMLSGDASNANFSSTMVAEGPAVKTFEEMQADLIEADIEIMERQLVVAATAGLIMGCSGDEDADDYILDQVKVEAEPPIIKSENRLQETQADQILFQGGIMSKETFAARNDLVWSEEEDKIEVENENAMGYAPGMAPPQLGPDGKPLPPGQPGAGQLQGSSSGQVAEDWLLEDGSLGRGHNAAKPPKDPVKPIKADADKLINAAWLDKTKKEIAVLSSVTAGKPKEVAKGIVGSLIGIINDHEVYGVPVDEVMRLYDMDFVVAGNHSKWPFIPAKQYWVDSTYSTADIGHDLLHEATEDTIMRELGWDYDDAHDYANRVELAYLKEIRNSRKALNKEGIPTITD